MTLSNLVYLLKNCWWAILIAIIIIRGLLVIFIYITRLVELKQEIYKSKIILVAILIISLNIPTFLSKNLFLFKIAGLFFRKRGLTTLIVVMVLLLVIIILIELLRKNKFAIRTKI